MRRAPIISAWKEDGVIKCSTHKTKNQLITITFNYKLLDYEDFDTEIFVGMTMAEARTYIFKIVEKQEKLLNFLSGESNESN